MSSQQKLVRDTHANYLFDAGIIPYMQWFIGIPALILLMVGLVGQAFEMRRIKIATYQDDLGSPNIFLDRRNFKWYGMIGIGIVMWYVAERM